jgi:hypothetical protein
VAQLLADRPELTLAPEGLCADDEARLRAAIGKLAAALAALDGLCREVTYVAATDEERSELNVEGVFAEPVELSACVELVPRELVVRLLDFFHERRLVSLSIRRDVPPPQLAGFVDLAAPRPAGPPAPFGEALTRAGILAISATDHDTIIPAKSGLSWSGRLALSRVSQLAGPQGATWTSPGARGT